MNSPNENAWEGWQRFPIPPPLRSSGPWWTTPLFPGKRYSVPPGVSDTTATWALASRSLVRHASKSMKPPSVGKIIIVVGIGLASNLGSSRTLCDNVASVGTVPLTRGGSFRTSATTSAAGDRHRLAHCVPSWVFGGFEAPRQSGRTGR